jgi:methyl-accepting chemotaxis protein
MPWFIEKSTESGPDQNPGDPLGIGFDLAYPQLWRAVSSKFRAFGALRAFHASKGIAVISIRKHLSAQFILILVVVFLVGTVLTGLFTWRMSSSASEEALLVNLDAQLGMLEASLNSLHEDAERSLKAALVGLAQLAPAPYVLQPGDQVNVGDRQAPMLRAGGTPLTGNHHACDQVSAIVGGVCSIFARQGDDFIRVSSTVKKPDGSRAVGTLLDRKSAAYIAAMKGEENMSVAPVQGKTFMALYRPIKDAQQHVIGVIAVGYDLTERLAAFRSQLSALKIGDTGYFYVLDATPGTRQGTFIVHPSLEGKIGLDIKDADGNPLIEAIVGKKNGVMRYRWINTNETRPREKVATFRHIASWNWIIAGGSYVDELTRSSQRMIVGLISGLVLQALAMIALIAWLFSRQIGRPLDKAQKAVAAIADGDLSQPVITDREDEIGAVLRSVETMRTNLCGMIGAVRHAAEELEKRAAQLAEAARHSGASAQEESASANSIAAEIEQLHGSLSVVDQNASEVQQFADKASEQSRRSSQVISQATVEMRKIAERVSDSARVVQELAGAAGHITDIVQVIQGLAEQTNLLALNAAIEAARAGEAGRGFAVVADEVRKLAEGTRQATERISSVVADIKSHSAEAAHSMGEVSTQVDQGVLLADEAQVATEAISRGADDLTKQLQSITQSLREQSETGSEIAGNVETVARKSEETAQDAAKVAEEVARMQALAAELASAVERFRLQ